MIVHVWRRAVAAEIGAGRRRLRRPRNRRGDRGGRRPGGVDRPGVADRLRPHPRRRSRASTRSAAHDAVVNVQGDLPMLDPAAIRVALAGLADPETDIATLAAMIEDDGGARRHQRQQGRRRFRRPGAAGARALFQQGRGAVGRRARITSISGSTPIAAPRSSGSSRCRAACSNSASGSSSCARSKPACASRSA